MGQPYLKYYSSDEPKAGADDMKLLHEHTYSSEGTHSYIPSPAIDFNTYSQIIILGTIQGKGVTTSLRLTINGLVTNYYKDGFRSKTGTLAVISTANANFWAIGSTAIFPATADRVAILHVTLQLPDTSLTNEGIP